MKSVLLAAGCMVTGALFAQDEQPADLTTREAAPRIGTTIIGERESPIGLYITPWRRSAAEKGIDRPARLLDEALEPIDPAVYARQMEYYTALTRALNDDTSSNTP